MSKGSDRKLRRVRALRSNLFRRKQATHTEPVYEHDNEPKSSDKDACTAEIAKDLQIDVIEGES